MQKSWRFIQRGYKLGEKSEILGIKSVIRRFYKHKMSKKNMLKEGFFKRDKRGQITLFVIIAIVAVALILVSLLWIRPTYFSKNEKAFDFDSCLLNAFEEEMVILGKQGGFDKPEFYYMHDGDMFPYLCYTNLYYLKCVVQKPLLIEHFQSELRKRTIDKVNTCFDSYADEFRERGYDVSSGDLKLDYEIVPQAVYAKVNIPVSVEKEDKQNYEEFKVKLNSNVYETLMIATSIIQYEALMGDSSSDSLRFFNPDFGINKITESDGTTLYIIQDKKTKFQFQFASRSMAWPSGYGSGTGLVKEY